MLTMHAFKLSYTVSSDKLLKRCQYTPSSAALLSALLSMLLRIVFAVLLTVDFGISSALLRVFFCRELSVFKFPF